MMGPSKCGRGKSGCSGEGALLLSTAGQPLIGWPLGRQGRADATIPPGRGRERLPFRWVKRPWSQAPDRAISPAPAPAPA